MRVISGPIDGQQISLESVVAGKSLGGGIFQWVASSTCPDDGGCVVAIAGVSTGRWLRQGIIDKTLDMFGAIGNGETNDMAALRRMFTSANNYTSFIDNFFDTFSLRHKYIVSATVSCGRPIKADARGAEFIVTGGSFPVFGLSMHNGR